MEHTSFKFEYVVKYLQKTSRLLREKRIFVGSIKSKRENLYITFDDYNVDVMNINKDQLKIISNLGNTCKLSANNHNTTDDYIEFIDMANAAVKKSIGSNYYSVLDKMIVYKKFDENYYPIIDNDDNSNHVLIIFPRNNDYYYHSTMSFTRQGLQIPQMQFENKLQLAYVLFPKNIAYKFDNAWHGKY